MSHILYQGNNLIVEGSRNEIYHRSPECIEWEEEMEVIFRFFIQVNWQMRVFVQSFTLIKTLPKEMNREADFSDNWYLKDWKTWYTLRWVLSSLGYKLSENESGESYWDSYIIKEWVNKLLK